MKKSSLILGTGVIITASLALAQTSFAKDTTGQVTYQTGGVILDPDPEVGEVGVSLPTDLNFGSHQIQTKKDETLVATVDGNQTSALTKGAVRVRDNRGDTTPIGWNIKVKQATQFTSVDSAKLLSGAQLSITTNPTISNSFNTTTGLTAQTNLVFDEIDEEKSIFSASAGNGNGESTLNLEKFQLDVAKNNQKVKEKYQTTLVWTISETP
ncbi:WxL domain-containing protein [Vagococcus sp. BWB3-3]|uniref:WxL domain-containing protein n=1 Tax=Vagococcus allomyrinae TaxID=2794353 RepID=A0A940STX4_9ENTE|nr:WxL domain-containing protein [Vagococcus allomyrinae]MBP1040154.1 WxL domain-containing protein [Vagococcus allomyrinae]